MPDINFQRTYRLGAAYEGIQERARHKLPKFWDDQTLFRFNDQEKSVTYTSERLIPAFSGSRPRVMLLFSNPHPHSIKQGMFLSPNTRGGENQFWPVMKKAGWLPIPKKERTPAQLANICLNIGYRGPFDLIFYCYYAFPSDYPEDIQKIFGKEYFKVTIQAESADEFIKTIQETSTEAVVTFNKGIFNLVSKDPVPGYIDRLKAGELVQSQIKGFDHGIPIFLTFPTGWRFHKDFKKLRVASLDQIRKAICGVSKSAK